MKWVTRLLGALLLGIPLLVSACGGKSQGDDDELPTFIEHDTFRELFPTQLCALIASCCDKIAVPIDSAICQAQAGQALSDLGGGPAYDGAAAAACLNGYSAALARCAVPSEQAISSCNEVFVGNVPAGGACISDDVCVPGAYCAPDATGAPSVCFDYTSGILRGVEGDRCVGSCADGQPCGASVVPGSMIEPILCYQADGLVCDRAATLSCVRSPAVGEPCDSYCAPGAYCDFALFQCVAALADGAFCEYPEQCQSGQCDGSCGGVDAIDAAICSQF